MTGWTPAHRKHVGELVAAEIERRGWNNARAARHCEVDPATIRRVIRADPAASSRIARSIAEGLDLLPADYLPPRDVREQTQLDNIEAMLRALLAQQGIDAADVLAAAAAAKAEADDNIEAKLRAEAQRTRKRPEGSP